MIEILLYGAAGKPGARILKQKEKAMDAEKLIEGYTVYTDAEELAASPEADEAPATVALSVATVLLSVKQGC